MVYLHRWKQVENAMMQLCQANAAIHWPTQIPVKFMECDPDSSNLSAWALVLKFFLYPKILFISQIPDNDWPGAKLIG